MIGCKVLSRIDAFIKLNTTIIIICSNAADEIGTIPRITG